MYTLCTTEKTAQQQHIFEQTFLQMMQEMYYDEITVSDLCRRAGLSRKIYYRLFDKKADVLYSLIDHTLIESDAYVPEEDVAPGELHRFFAFWRYKKDLLDVLLKHQNSHLLTDRAVRFALLEESSPVRAFGIDKVRGSQEAIAFYLSAMFSIVLLWHANGYRQSIDELSEIMMDLLVNPAILEKRPCR